MCTRTCGIDVCESNTDRFTTVNFLMWKIFWWIKLGSFFKTSLKKIRYDYWPINCQKIDRNRFGSSVFHFDDDEMLQKIILSAHDIILFKILFVSHLIKFKNMSLSFFVVLHFSVYIHDKKCTIESKVKLSNLMENLINVSYANKCVSDTFWLVWKTSDN